MLLGALMKTMAAQKLSLSQAASPSIGFSFAEIVEIARGVQSRRLCPNRRRSGRYSSPADDCGLESYLDPAIKSLENNVNGLLLEDFSLTS